MALTKITTNVIEDNAITADKIDTSSLTAAGFATEGYVTTAVANLVDSAPLTLDTLNELAAALGDDPNFATTVTNSIATKLPLSGGTITGNINFGDNIKANFGTGSDLQIYHDGTNSYIESTAPYTLIESGTLVFRNTAGTEDYAKFNENSDVKLYFNNSEKFATTAAGIDVTGTVTADKVTIGTSSASNGKLTLEGVDGGDSAGIYFNNTTATNGKSYSLSSGNSGEFMLYDRTSSAYRLFVSSAGNVGIGTSSPVYGLDVRNTIYSAVAATTTNLTLGDITNGTISGISTNNNNLIFLANGSAESMRIDSSGIDVAGTVTADGLTVGDNQWIYAGNGADLKIGHDGTDSIFRAQGSPLYIDANGTTFRGYSPYTKHMEIASNGDISFYEDTGTTAKFFWDASAQSLGIGTSSPATALDVVGSVTAVGGSISGNLLVGASSPSAKLTVGTFGDTARAAQFHGGSILVDGGAASEIIIGDGNVAYMSIQTTDNATAMKIRNFSGNADLVTIERDGNVGIGTSSPTSKLQIGGMAAGEQALLIESGRNDALSNGLVRINITDSVCPFAGLQIDHAGTGAAIIANGNVGIGTSAPGYMLDVAEKIRMVGGLKITPTTSNLYTEDGALSYYSATNGVYLNGAGETGWLRLQASGANNGNNRIDIYGTNAGNYMDFKVGTSASSLRLQPHETVFNEGHEDMDFRVESDTNTHALFVDAGNNRVSTDATFLHDSDTGNQRFYITRQGATSQSGSMYVDDNTFVFDSIQDETSGANILFRATNASINNMSYLELAYSSGAIFNEGGESFQDFRVESDTNTHALFVDAGNGRVGILNSGPVTELEVNGSTTLGNAAGSSTAYTRLQGFGVDSLGTRYGTYGQLIFNANTGYTASARRFLITNGYQVNKLAILGSVDANTDPTIATGGGVGSGFARLVIDGDGNTHFNVAGTDSDFRVESNDNSSAIFVDASQNKVVFGGSGSPVINVGSTRTYDAVATTGIALGSALYTHGYIGNNGVAGDVYIASNAYPANVGASRSIRFAGGTAGGGFNDNIVTITPDSGTVFNEDSTDLDFRVESDSNTHALFVDASVGSVHFGGTSNGQYNQTTGNGEATYLIDNGSSYGSLLLSNNADRGWSMMYGNKFQYTSGDDRRYIAWYVNGGALANLQLNAAGTQVEYNTGSDRRLKENIVDIDDGIVRLKQMQPRKYTWVGTDFPAEGFIADEADGIVPEAVKGEVGAVDDEGNPIYQQIEYSRYVPLLTAALKEAVAKIEALEARIAQLENT